MKQLLNMLGWLALAAVMTSCQAASGGSFPANPTSSGSRYSNYGLPSSKTGFQNADLED